MMGDKGVREVRERKYDVEKNNEVKESKYLKNVDENSYKDFGDKWNTLNEETGFLKDHDQFLTLNEKK